MKKFLQNDVFIGLALSLAAFGVYLLTLAPTVTFIDSGELATVAATLGIAHPTGYPLFALLGWLFAHLPISARIIWKLNLMSAVFCAAAVFLCYRLFLFLLSEKERDGEALSFIIRNRIAAATAVLALAFSRTFWSQAVAIEVYALHLLFLALALWLFLRAMTEHALKNGSGRWWYAFAFVLGLSFTNHMTTILLAPGFLYLYFAVHGFSRSSWKKIGRAALPFMGGLSVYLYLPLRASRHPLMNWGNPVELHAFWRHVTAANFHGFMFSSWDVMSRQAGHFISSFSSEVGIAALPLAIIGLADLLVASRRLFFFSLLLFFGCVAYSINYDIPDIDSYFLLAYIAFALWEAYGIRRCFEIGQGTVWHFGVGLICALTVVLPLWLNHHDADESHDFAVEDYVMNMLEPLGAEAVVFSAQWDYLASPSYYFQSVEGLRPDVTVIDRELLMHSWYHEQLRRNHPELISGTEPKIDAFLLELRKFERNEAFDSVAFGNSFADMYRSLMSGIARTKPVYLTPEVAGDFRDTNFSLVPDGLVFRLTRDTTGRSFAPKRFVFRPIPKSNRFTEDVKGYYAAGYVTQAVYADQLGDRQRGLEFLKAAVDVKPGFPPAVEWMDRLQGLR